MNISDLNARSSLTKRQRRSLAPRVECLESREVLTYPAGTVNFLIYEAVVKHVNTAFLTINTVNNSLRSDLAFGPYTQLVTAGVTTANANAFTIAAAGLITNYAQSAAAQLSPRFPFVTNSILFTAGSTWNQLFIENAVYQANPTPATAAAYITAVTNTIIAV